MLYLYALAAELGDAADVRGVQNEPLALLPFRGAVVVAGEVTAVPAIDAAALKAQDALVRALHDRSSALLPMRFGTTAADPEALHTLMDDRLIDRLATVRGCEQMTVRVVSGGAEGAADAAGGEASAATGTGYLAARAKARQPSREMGAIAAAAASIVRDARLEAVNRHGVHGAVYHLIERGRAGEYRLLMESAAAAIPTVRVIITGPSPAYAFA